MAPTGGVRGTQPRFLDTTGIVEASQTTLAGRVVLVGWPDEGAGSQAVVSPGLDTVVSPGLDTVRPRF